MKTLTPIQKLRLKLATMKGAGDAVALVAQPVARVIDAAAGTNLQGCGGCKGRRDALNAALPFRPVDTPPK